MADGSVRDCNACDKAIDDHTLKELREHHVRLLARGVDLKAAVLDFGEAVVPAVIHRFVRVDGTPMLDVMLGMSESAIRGYRGGLANVLDDALKATRKKRKQLGVHEDASAANRDADASRQLQIAAAKAMEAVNKLGVEKMADEEVEVPAESVEAVDVGGAEPPLEVLEAIWHEKMKANAEGLMRLMQTGQPQDGLQIMAMRLQSLAEYIMPKRNLLEFEIGFETRLAEQIAAAQEAGARATLLQGVAGVDPRKLQPGR